MVGIYFIILHEYEILMGYKTDISTTTASTLTVTQQTYNYMKGIFGPP